MAGDLIISASSIITMNPAAPRAAAVAVDTTNGTIVGVGSLAQCRAAAAGGTERDLGDTVLMPGFIEAHSHPFLSGVVTQPPAYWIAPYVGYPGWDDVAALFRKVQAEQPAGATVMFNGLDRLLQQVAEPDNTTLDAFFPNRPVAVFDNSGHEVYFNSAAIAFLGWAAAAPPDPAGARFGRNADGTSNGRAYETAAVMAVAAPLMASAIGHPLFSAAQWYALMARGGITATTDMTYSTPYLVGYEALVWRAARIRQLRWPNPPSRRRRWTCPSSSVARTPAPRRCRTPSPSAPPANRRRWPPRFAYIRVVTPNYSRAELRVTVPQSRAEPARFCDQVTVVHGRDPGRRPQHRQMLSRGVGGRKGSCHNDTSSVVRPLMNCHRLVSCRKPTAVPKL